MRHLAAIILLALVPGGCDRPGDDPAASSSPPVEAAPPATAGPPPTRPHWTIQTSAAQTALVLATHTGERVISLSCAAGKNRLSINVPGFTPIGSEDRLSFGNNGEVEALVADSRGDRQRGGVSAEGPVPANVAALVSGSLSASYGAQTSGPHPAVPRDLARAFATACRGADAGASAAAVPDRPVTPCRLQDGQPLSALPRRAVGTEPFWAARIEGRCVTYSHPEDQQGTRVWTRFTPTRDGGVWTGALGGHPFELHTRATPGCSDGMSDKSYPEAVELLVNGEQRKGCAEPL